MNPPLSTLLQLCHRIGVDPALIQGGGGNISVKTAAAIYIKASGTTLANMSEQNGYAIVERATQRIIGPNPTARPSMELPMHLSLPTYVIHTHPVYVNIFNCMVGGSKLLQEQFKQYHPFFISYHTPGQELAEAIQQQLKAKPAPKLLFLENHGLITCSDNANEALQLTLTISATLEQYLKTTLPNFKPFHPTNYQTTPPVICLFPDAAVFLNTNKINAGIQEVFAANAYITNSIDQLKAVPQYLSEEAVWQLQHMESEQYRIKLTN